MSHTIDTDSGSMLKSPFPYFGGKSRAASIVWPRFGEVRNYVEPFVGSAAMLLLRPQPFAGTETVNDADGMLANFWRALQSDPEGVAHHADWPVNENDMHARHVWLVERRESLQSLLEGDPEYFDAKIAGWWVWGMACWIGSGFCSGRGPWRRAQDESGNWILSNDAEVHKGACRQLVHLGNAGRGVNRKRVHLGNAGQDGIVEMPAEGSTANGSSGDLLGYFEQLADRFRRVRVCCGDWKRVCGPTPTTKLGTTAVFLDPPYADTAGRAPELYRIDSQTVAHDVREWAIEHGDDPKLRIALCGYDGEHNMPSSWSCVEGKATNGGFGSQAQHRTNNHKKERIWFSPHCLPLELSRKQRRLAECDSMPLFSGLNL